jgi:ABC-2 type transport system ATP-binding protein
VLKVESISKRFAGRHALADASLEVRAGEAVLLVGRNGAGKTTLLRIVTGYLDPDAGAVTVDGIAMTSTRTRARAQAKLGYLPEHVPTNELTVHEHLRSRARLKGLARGCETAVARALQAAAIEDVAGQHIATLSKGYRQRVSLADALLGDPPLLVLDEPTSGMDPIQTRDLRELLMAIARDRAVLVSSHAVADLEPMASRVAVLSQGRIVAVGTRQEICARAGTATLEDAVIALIGEARAA